MELTESQQRILKPFVDATVTCLKTMGGLTATPGRGSREEADAFWANDYVFVIDTQGEIEGHIVVHYRMENTLDIGNKIRAGILGDDCTDATEIDDEIIEALAEFSNTMVGRAMRHLESQHTLVSFSPPRFIDNAEKTEFLKKGVQDVLTIPLNIDGLGQFQVNYLIQCITEL